MAYRIRKAPLGRRDVPTFYCRAEGKVHWTTFRELAQRYDLEEAAGQIVKRIRNTNGKLANSVSVEPC